MSRKSYWSNRFGLTKPELWKNPGSQFFCCFCRSWILTGCHHIGRANFSLMLLTQSTRPTLPCLPPKSRTNIGSWLRCSWDSCYFFFNKVVGKKLCVFFFSFRRILRKDVEGKFIGWFWYVLEFLWSPSKYCDYKQEQLVGKILDKRK